MRKRIALLLALVGATAGAQQPTSPRRTVVVEERAAADSDVATIDGVMRAFYDVISGPKGQPRQWARDRSLYVKDIRFYPMGMRAGKPALSIMGHQQYVDQVDSSFVANGFTERETLRCTRRFGNLAQVWSAYEEFTADLPAGREPGRGVNALQLHWDGARWWITSVSWDSERPGNKTPADVGSLCKEMGS